MSASFRAVSSQTTASSTNLVGNRPTGTADGDMLVAAILNSSGAAITGVPSGWTLRATAGAMVVYTKTASNEPSTWTWNTASAVAALIVVAAYLGADANSYDTSSATTGSGTAAAAPSVTTAVAGETVVCVAAQISASTWTPPAAMTERFDGTGSSISMELSDGVFASAGATGAQTATATVSSAWDVALIAIKPASGGALFFGSL